MGGSSKILMLLLCTPFPLLYPPRPSSTLRLARHSRNSATSFSTLVFSTPQTHRIHSPSSSHSNNNNRGSSNNKSLYSSSSLSSDQQHQLHTQTAGYEVTSGSHTRLPEWSKFIDHLVDGGYFDTPHPQGTFPNDQDAFTVYQNLPEEFLKVAQACLAFARNRPDVLRLLSRKNMEIIVENGSPFLFKTGADSARRMKLFLNGVGSNVFQSERAQTVDIMRYLLSYAYSSLITSDGNNLKDGQMVEASVRSLLIELVSASATLRESGQTDLTARQPPLRHEQLSRPAGQNIEMKRGDWTCPKCTFMNFARNMRCLECDEMRPKRQLTGSEWECPQCDFYNYGRNMSCLRCDCKRPGETLPSTAYNRNASADQILSGSNTGKSELEKRLAANDEKAERWFSKVSQLGDSSDLSSAIDDDDFPEIMPLRKGVNRFVVSTRKTPLERRLANSQSGISSGMVSDKPTESSISQSVNRILDGMPTPATGETNTGVGVRSNSLEYIADQKGNQEHVPFVPLPRDMFSKSQKLNNDRQQPPDIEDPATRKDVEASDYALKSSDSRIESKNNKESSHATGRWFNKVSELDNATDMTGTTPDEDFSEIMPMRKGENRFVVSKKKDRSLTSPQYKRCLALEQANGTNFVPFVPFPPDYFAKKDKQPEATSPNKGKTVAESFSPPEKVQGVPEKFEQSKAGTANWGSSDAYSENDNARLSEENFNERKMDSDKDSWNHGAPRMSSASKSSSDTGSSTHRVDNSGNARESWNRASSGKSLEGSAVKEPDPLDMSEDAKAERWFRRVAQIKDISELSQIPDEDFPEIMPMRKGVNRFVVSKRKTPLERRLTSPQYRRNLPVVSSDPEKDSS